MTFRRGERVYVGNSFETSIANGYINLYLSSNGYVELLNTRGTFKSGDIIYGIDSQFSARLNEYVEKRIEPEMFFNDFIILDTGEAVALDAHFSGLPSQDYSDEYILTL